VVNAALAMARRKLLPSALWQGVGVPAHQSAVIPSVHNVNYFGAQCHGLHSRYTRLHTPCCQDACGFATGPLAKL